MGTHHARQVRATLHQRQRCKTAQGVGAEPLTRTIASLNDAQVFVIVNKADNTLTGNLQGPLVINTTTRMGEQFVLAEKRWSTRHTLVKLNATPGQSAMSA